MVCYVVMWLRCYVVMRLCVYAVMRFCGSVVPQCKCALTSESAASVASAASAACLCSYVVVMCVGSGVMKL